MQTCLCERKDNELRKCLSRRMNKDTAWQRMCSGSPRRPTSRESSKAEGSTSMPPRPAADRPRPSSRHASEAAAPAAGPAAATSSNVCLQRTTPGHQVCSHCISNDDKVCWQRKVTDDGMSLQCTPSQVLKTQVQPLACQQSRVSTSLAIFKALFTDAETANMSQMCHHAVNAPAASSDVTHWSGESSIWLDQLEIRHTAPMLWYLPGYQADSAMINPKVTFIMLARA